MTEEKSFDQPQMSKPDIPKEEGVHSVAGKKQGKLLNMRFLYFGGAAALGLIALIAYLPPHFLSSKSCKNRSQRCLQQIFQSLTALLQLSSLLYD